VSLTYVNVVKEIYDRISGAIGVGEELSGILGVYYDPPSAAFRPDQLPVVCIYDLDIERNDCFTANNEDDIMTVCIELVCAKPATGSFDYANGTGPLVYLEKLLNVIEKKTNGTIDITCSPYCVAIKSRKTTKSYLNDCISYRTLLRYQLKSYSAGGR